MIRKFFTSLNSTKLFLLLLIGVLIGVSGGYAYQFIKKHKDPRNIKKDGPKVTWTNQEGERLTGFEGEIIELENDIMQLERAGKKEVIKIKDDALIAIEIAKKQLDLVDREEIRVGDKVALMAIEKEGGSWTTGYVKILRE